MSIRYNNIKLFLTQNNYSLLNDYDDFINNNEVQYKCINNHISKLTTNSFLNKRHKTIQLCSKCSKLDECNEKLRELQCLVDKNGHIILEYKNNKDIVYKCGNCNSVNHANSLSLSRETSSKFCSKCQNNKNKLKYEDIKVRIEKLGFKLLINEGEYINNKQKLNLLCRCGEKFNMKLHDIERGRSCMKCKIGKSQKLCQKFFEQILQENFETIRPHWLNKLELDGYNETLKLAFEYQGIQHYKYSPDFFHKNGIGDFYKQQERDKLKRQLCKDNKITLIEIPYQYNYTEPDNLYKYILNQLVEKEIIIIIT